MELLTKELREAIPPLYSQENNPDPLVYAHFRLAGTDWHWYVLECGLPEDREPEEGPLLFGLVTGFEAELGYFSLLELEQEVCTQHELDGKLFEVRMRVTRDLSWQPTPLSQVRASLAQPS